ncbi:MAG: hypothetical protein M3067_14465 [Chloroflexota bacterium]|nr:hypothetical protein [Chloroflexota bacterium]
MQKLAIALALAVSGALGGLSPSAVPAASAASGARVVIIVGATHSATPGYRADADSAYAEAIKWTPNVTRVYSPYATWATVKAAVKGANLVIYFGHGNGWPSPYPNDALYTGKDGFGLNATAGNGDYNNKYYGEAYIATLGLAPNALVILSHLCYASGNSEPGRTAPTLSVAKQRADNYATAFLKAGARAVIADGHMNPNYYIQALFSSHQTIDGLWQDAPNFHAHAFNFPSVRSPGFTVQMDPDQPTSGYYRSITGKLDLRTDEILGSSAYAVPGAWSVGGALQRRVPPAP